MLFRSSLIILSQVISNEEDFAVVGKATNGEDTLNMIREKEPDVVLLDLIMPKLDGLGVMERLREDKNIKKTPTFIVISAVGQEGITDDAFSRGANYYIMKPFDNNVLINRIRYVKNNRQAFQKTNTVNILERNSTPSDRNLE